MNYAMGQVVTATYLLMVQYTETMWWSNLTLVYYVMRRVDIAAKNSNLDDHTWEEAMAM